MIIFYIYYDTLFISRLLNDLCYMYWTARFIERFPFYADRTRTISIVILIWSSKYSVLQTHFTNKWRFGLLRRQFRRLWLIRRGFAFRPKQLLSRERVVVRARWKFTTSFFIY